jgi:hypothetical protein
MTSPLDLVKAIRSGKLADVRAVLDAGVPVELTDGPGDPGLPMGIACFMGFVDIVRELAGRGAKVNLPDNRLPISPLSMAIRGSRTEVVRTLIELGAAVPAGMPCGLTEQEVILAEWKAQRAGHLAPRQDVPDVEEIEVGSCFGTDTQVLEADVLRAARGGR